MALAHGLSKGKSVTDLGKIYIDTGNGYNENEACQMDGSIDSGCINYHIHLPAGVWRVRFDPVGGISCVLKSLIIKIDGRVVPFSCNGIILNDYLIFGNTDTHCEVKIDYNTECTMDIQGGVSYLSDISTPAINLLVDRLDGVVKKASILSEKLLTQSNKIVEQKKSIIDGKRQQEELNKKYDDIIHSTSWKITKPIRLVKQMMMKFASIASRCRKSFKKVGLNIRVYGFKNTLRKILKRLKPRFFKSAAKKAASSHIVPKRIRKLQENREFPRNVKISVLTPLYNTPVKLLRDMLQSVKNQTYLNWELCLADGSDANHTYVKKECVIAAKSDSRIKYMALEQNEGISENTNRCLELSTGEYIGLLDHDDILHPSALYEVMNVICENNADFIYTDESTFIRTPKGAYCPNFKPDFSPDMLRSQNYICHFTVYSRKLLDKVGKYNRRFDGSQDYDMVLRLTEVAENIVHIPKILYYWRASVNSVAGDINAKSYAIEAAKGAIRQHLNRIGLEGTVEDSTFPSTYRIRYEIKTNPLVSIIIPNKDHVGDLTKCIKSVIQLSTYKNYEIIIVENGSVDEATFAYYTRLSSEYGNIKTVSWNGEFNFSAINNFGFRYAQGEYVILLNNDVEIITTDWIQEMLMFAQREDVGAVGAMLYYPDDTVQHAGVILGIGGIAGHSHKYLQKGAPGYMSRASYAQNLSAVTAACMMVPRKIFEQLNGLDEEFIVAFNDVDFCMRIRRAGYLIVFTPYAELYHFESKSRGYEDTPEKQKRFGEEIKRFHSKWEKELTKGDPYYNPNLTLESDDFSVK